MLMMGLRLEWNTEGVGGGERSASDKKFMRPDVGRFDGEP